MQLIDEVGIACDTLDQVWAVSIEEQATIDTVTEINGADTLADVLTNIFGTTVTEVDKLCDEQGCQTLTDALNKYTAVSDTRTHKIMAGLQRVIDNIDCRDNWDTRDDDNWNNLCADITDAMVFINQQFRLNSDLIKPVK